MNLAVSSMLGILYLIDSCEYGLHQDIELDPSPEKQSFVDSYFAIRRIK